MMQILTIRSTAAAVFAIAVLTADPGWSQAPKSPGKSAPGAASSNPATPAKPMSAADQAIREAYEKTKTASTMEELGIVINLCQDGLNQGATGESAAYALKLQAWAYNKRGEKHANSGDEKLALKDFEIATSLDPTLWKALHNRAVSRAALDELKGALADFDAVIRMSPRYANAWYNRGELKSEQGDFAGALRDYDQAIQLQSGDAGFYNSRGNANYRLGKFREALEDYSRAVRIDPNDAAALVNRGDAYREQ